MGHAKKEEEEEVHRLPQELCGCQGGVREGRGRRQEAAVEAGEADHQAVPRSRQEEGQKGQTEESFKVVVNRNRIFAKTPRAERHQTKMAETGQNRMFGRNTFCGQN